jgi:hypothetical protein
MATIHETKQRFKGDHGKLFGEAGKLLDIAESLLEKREGYQRRLEKIGILGLGATSFLVAGGTFLIFSPLSSAPANLFLVVLAYLYAFLLGVFCFLAWARTTELIKRENRAFYEIGDLLRALELGIVEQESLTELEQAEFRIRLSRFDIGPGSNPRQ